MSGSPPIHVTVAESGEVEAHVVAVHPPAEFARRRRLFAALEVVTDFRFEPADGVSGRNVGAAILFEERTSGMAIASVPTLILPRSVGAPVPPSSIVEFSASPVIDAALRGTSLSHAPIQGHAGGDHRADDVFAAIGRSPAWIRDDASERVHAELAELEPDETLRQRLGGPSFLALVALVDFLRRTHPNPWIMPDVRASFLFDDPNLHAESYGFINFAAVAEDAARWGYHAAFATIPLDAWYARRAVAGLFQANPRSLSLLMHGNNHVRRELARPVSERDHRASMAQALRRIGRFEDRYGLTVDRVMAPPHGACSLEAASAMVELGFEGLCVSRPYPWLDRVPSDQPIAGWRPADSVTGGLSVIPRLPIAELSPQEQVLRSFLRQPLILYGHHEDVGQGLGVLSHAAGVVSQAPGVSWMSIGQITRSLYATRRYETRLDVRLFTRHVEVVVPEGVAEIVVSTAYPLGPLDRVAVQPVCDGRVTVRVERRDAVDPGSISSPLPAVWPILRRGLSETRDRLQPIARRARSRADAKG